MYICIFDFSDKIKRDLFQTLFVLPYECTPLTLTKRIEKRQDGNYTRMLRAVLNKCWKQHLKKQHLYSYLPPTSKAIQVKRTRHAGHCCRSKDKHRRASVGRPAKTSISSVWRCSLCNGYHRRKWTRRHEFKSWMKLIAYHITLIPFLGKGMNQVILFPAMDK